MDRTSIDLDRLRRMEAASERAWPAAEVIPYDGWEIRVTGDIGRRVNSVGAVVAGTLPVRDKIAHCEAFYRERGMPPRWKLTAASLPAELDALLIERGYEIEAPVSVQTRPLGDIAVPDTVEVAGAPTPEWVAANIRIGGHGTWNPDLFPLLLDRIALPTAYAAVWDDDEIIATGMAVAEADLVGLFEVVTDQSRRGRGLATAVIEALLAWGRARDATTGYLQVMLDNDPALRLYGRLGFTETYRYWYRRGAESPGSVPDPAR